MRPTSEQSRLLEALQAEVFAGMEGMKSWLGQDLDQLRRIPLGVLRRGTVRRHGVARRSVLLGRERGQLREPRLEDVKPREPLARALRAVVVHATADCAAAAPTLLQAPRVWRRPRSGVWQGGIGHRGGRRVKVVRVH